jgi:hydroxymethylpyrimidine/phosphomethylpyrimidine kinase
MSRKTNSVLTIAGSDSGGGAGIQADLKTIAALGLHGTSVITCVTAQNPRRVIAIQETSPALVRAQLEAVFEAFPPQAIKTGMLYSITTIKEVARFLGQLNRQVPLIVDPVLVSTSGRRLLEANALRAMREELFPLATLITPNIPEAEVLGNLRIRKQKDAVLAARALYKEFGCAVLVKGGHLQGTSKSTDIFYDGTKDRLLTALRIRGVKTHGTGCTYSAAIAGYVALGMSLPIAVQAGKKFVTKAIQDTQKVGSADVLRW